MGEVEGVGRVYRTEFKPPVDRHPQLDKTDRDKHGRDHEEHPEEEPHDTVELHEEVAPLPQEDQDGRPPKHPPKDRGLDISA